jgi:hypothetical protein
VLSWELDLGWRGLKSRELPGEVLRIQPLIDRSLAVFGLKLPSTIYSSGNTMSSASLRRTSKLVAFPEERLFNDRIS